MSGGVINAAITHTKKKYNVFFLIKVLISTMDVNSDIPTKHGI